MKAALRVCSIILSLQQKHVYKKVCLCDFWLDVSQKRFHKLSVLRESLTPSSWQATFPRLVITSRHSFSWAAFSFEFVCFDGVFYWEEEAVGTVTQKINSCEKLWPNILTFFTSRGASRLLACTVTLLFYDSKTCAVDMLLPFFPFLCEQASSKADNIDGKSERFFKKSLAESA